MIRRFNAVWQQQNARRFVRTYCAHASGPSGRWRNDFKKVGVNFHPSLSEVDLRSETTLYARGVCGSDRALRYLQRKIHVEVSGPQELDEKAVGEGPDGGQLAGVHRSPPQAADERPELLRVVRELIKLRPVHVAPRSGYIPLSAAGC